MSSFIRRYLPLLLALGTAQAAFAADAALDIVDRARSYLGAAYCHGGTSSACFDCSGFVTYLYRDRVPGLPRWSREMASFGRPVPVDELRPGDLLFYATGTRSGVVTHVAIYAGQSSIIHAISDGPNRGVALTRLDARYWRNRFVGARRVLEEVAPTETETEGLRFARGEYRGELRSGEPHGTGTLLLDNGDRYDGQFRDGTFHGEGTYRWADGEVYDGRFIDGAPVPDAGQSESVREPDRETYLSEPDSPWDTWDGVVEGDFEAWREAEEQAFREFLQRNR